MLENKFIKNTFSKFIEVRGSDSAKFLQSLITNDLNKCKKNDELIYSCFLSPQGKFLADFFITYINNFYLIEIHEKFFQVFLNLLLPLQLLLRTTYLS